MVEAQPAVEPDREALKQSLLAQAAEHWANWDDMPTIEDDQTLNYISKQTWDDGGIPLTLVKYRAEGLTMEQLQPWIDDPVQVGSVINTRGTFEPLPDH